MQGVGRCARASLARLNALLTALAIAGLTLLSAPTVMAQSDIWSASLVPKRSPSTFFWGCANNDSDHLCTDQLSPDSFTYSGTTYQVTEVTVKTLLDGTTELVFGLNHAIPKALSLYVGSREYSFGDAQFAGDKVAKWSPAGLTWVGNSTVSLSLKLDTTSPAVSSATVDGATLTVNFDGSLDTSSVPAPGDFHVTVGSSRRHVAAGGVSIVGKTVTLTLSSAVIATDTVKVGYTQPSANALQDANGNKVATFTDQDVTNNSPPVILSVATTSTPDHDSDRSGTPDTYSLGGKIAVEVTFSEAVAVSGGNANVRLRLDLGADDADLDNSRKLLQLHSANGPTLRFEYTVTAADTDPDGIWVQKLSSGSVLGLAGGATITSPRTSHNAVLTKDGLPTSGDPNHKVDGSVDQSPMFQGAVVNGKRLTITFNRNLDESSVPLPAAFPVTVGTSSPAHPAEVDIAGATVVLTLSSPVGDADTVKVKYTKADAGANPLRSITSIEAAAFADQEVTNETPSGVPTMLSVSITSAPSLDADGDGTPDTYGQGETIFVDVRFDQPVGVDDGGAAGNVFVWLDMAPNGALRLDEDRRALPFHGLGRGGRIMRFQYTVTAADRDADGVFVQPDLDNDTVVFLKGGASVKSPTTDRLAVLKFAGLPFDGDTSHRVDGSAIVTAPALSRAVVNGRTLTLRFSEALDPSSAPAGEAFTVSGGRSGTGTAIVSGNMVTVTLDAAVERGEAVTVSYAAPSSNPLRDADGNAVASFSARSATNVEARREPLADAGPDRTVGLGARVRLDGWASVDPDGDTLTYAWTQTGGPALNLSGSRSITASFTAPEVAGTLTFRLTVTDPEGLSDSDEVTVTVRDLEMSFGDARVGRLLLSTGEMMEPLQLPEASGGGGGVRYGLTSTPAGLAGLDLDPVTRWLTGTPTAAGTFTFMWRATDEDGETAAIAFLVRVNGVPAARAGADFSVDPGAPARLDGSGSADPDGDRLTFAWTQTLGARVALSDANHAQPSFEAPWRPEPLVFRLTVTDPGGLFDSDEVRVTVRDLAPSFGDAEVAPLVLDVGNEMRAVVLPEASGGNGALSYRLTSAPAGLVGLDFDPAKRRLSGTPDAKGQYVFTYRADDADGNRQNWDAALLTFTVTVNPSVEARKRILTRTLAAVGSTALSSALDTIGSRFADAMPGTTVSLAGEQLSFAVPGGVGGAHGACPAGGYGGHDSERNGFGGGAVEGGFGRSGFGAGARGCGGGIGALGAGGDAGWGDLLRSSAFSLSLGQPGADDATAWRWGVWGGGDVTEFAGEPDPGSRYRGEAWTGWLGIDARAGRWVAGLAASYGVSESNYRFAGGEETDEWGRLVTNLAAFYPYARWTLGKGLEVRGLAGAGLGVARHRIWDRERESSDLWMSMGSVGVRQALPAVAGVNVAVRTDASFARLGTGEGEEAVHGLRANISRARMGLEVSRGFALGAGAAIEPFVESSMRRDGGDGLTGNGFEHLVGMRFLTARLQVEARGRLLSLHTAEAARERGASLTARLSPKRDGRGLSLSLMPQWGAATGAADALWREEMPRLHGVTGSGSGTLDANLGYGVRLAAHGLLTPFATARASGHGRGLRLGTRFGLLHADLDVELSGERRERSVTAPDHGVRLDLRLRF